MDVKRFREDLYALARRACKDDDKEVLSKMLGIAEILVGLYKNNLVKINHSALELVCARDLIIDGYEVRVEQRLDRALVCDVMGKRGDGALIVEIETGFIPPEAALEPAVYAKSRIASKIARYSGFAGKFALGTTPSYVLDFSPFFVRPPLDRSREEVEKIKALTDIYYDNPPISADELLQARLHSVFVIDVDTGTTREVDPETYAQNAATFVRQNHESGVSRRL